MKPLLALALLFVTAAATGARAQTHAAGDPPELQVVKFSWSKERINWERDPFSGPVESFDQMRVRTRNEKRISDAKAGGNSIEVDRVTREAKADSANLEEIRRRQVAPPRYGFMYKVSFRNNAAQPIKSLDWDHVFFDPETKTETARHQFTGDEKISPGKQKEFTVFSPHPPSHTVSVQKLDKRERDRLGETIVVMRIRYADGSIWQRQ
ncbi:MAG TPA: hypothetical protein VK363_15000 [Pyrinomonadaceae bacterium]|nr:hypothetical protein [Pyrinomonadaceae bacterium]